MRKVYMQCSHIVRSYEDRNNFCKVVSDEIFKIQNMGYEVEVQYQSCANSDSALILGYTMEG